MIWWSKTNTKWNAAVILCFYVVLLCWHHTWNWVGKPWFYLTPSHLTTSDSYGSPSFVTMNYSYDNIWAAHGPTSQICWEVLDRYHIYTQISVQKQPFRPFSAQFSVKMVILLRLRIQKNAMVRGYHYQQTLQLFSSDNYCGSCSIFVHLGGTLRLGSGQHCRI